MTRTGIMPDDVAVSEARIEPDHGEPAAALIDCVEDMAAMLALHDCRGTEQDLEQLELDGYFDPDNLHSPRITSKEARLLAAAWALEATRAHGGTELLLTYGGPTITLKVTSRYVRLERSWTGNDWAETTLPTAIVTARDWVRRYGSIVGRDPR